MEEKDQELEQRSGSMVEQMAGKVGHNLKKKFTSFKRKMQAYNQ